MGLSEFFKRRKKRKLVKAMGTAVLAGDVKRVKVLLKEDPGLVNTQDEYGITPLHRAANADVVKLLLAEGAEVNARSSSGATPLHSAALEGRTDVVKLLLAEGAEVNAREPEGYTPLYWAAMKGHVEVMRVVLAHGAAIDAPDQFGKTPLAMAASQGDAEVVRVLLAHGANINSRASLGFTPLHTAATKGHAEVVRVLLAHGANINAQTDHGATPLHLAAHKGHARVAELLRKDLYERLWEQIRSDKPIFLFLRTNRLGTERMLSDAMAQVFVRLAKDYHAPVESITVNADECRELTTRLGIRIGTGRITALLSIPCFALIRGGITVGNWRLVDVAGAYEWNVIYDRDERRPEPEVIARLTIEESVRQRLDALRPTIWFLINC